MLIQPSRTKAALRFLPQPTFQEQAASYLGTWRRGPRLQEFCLPPLNKNPIHLCASDTQPSTKSATDGELRKFSVRECPQSSTFSKRLQSSRALAGPAPLCNHTRQFTLSSFSAAARRRGPTYTQPPTFLSPHVCTGSLRDTPQLVPPCLWLLTPQKGFSPFAGYYFHISPF